MVFNLNQQSTIANRFIAELRDVNIQKDSMRFRRNLERIGEILAYEISKTLEYEIQDVETPLGVAQVNMPTSKIVLATILRAGLPFHQGMLNYFDDSGNAFVSAYRKHHKNGSFEIKLEYVSCPNLEDKILVLSDTMLATGASMSIAAESLLEYGKPSKVHFAAAVASVDGLNHIKRLFPDAVIWIGALDEELTAKSYIVPGLGDAGDLSYGVKVEMGV